MHSEGQKPTIGVGHDSRVRFRDVMQLFRSIRSFLAFLVS